MASEVIWSKGRRKEVQAENHEDQLRIIANCAADHFAAVGGSHHLLPDWQQKLVHIRELLIVQAFKAHASMLPLFLVCVSGLGN